jgi:hypothetical protein
MPPKLVAPLRSSKLTPCSSSPEGLHGFITISDIEEQLATHLEAGNATFPNPKLNGPWTDAVAISNRLLRDQIAEGRFFWR